jgi:hypothetical protein
MCRAVSVQKGMWIGSGNWMYVEQILKKNWNRVEVGRETEQGEEECRASEKAGMLIGKAELPQLKKGMPLKPTKPRVEPTNTLDEKTKTNRKLETLPQCYTDPATLSPKRLKRHRFADPSPNSDSQKTP